jgi:hypothetical protein
MEIKLLLLLLVAVLVVPKGDVEVEVVVVLVVDVILEVQTGSHEPHKCTHCGCSNHSVDYCWDLHGKLSRSANQVSSQEDSPATSRPPANSSPTLDSNLISIPRDEYAQFLAHK